MPAPVLGQLAAPLHRLSKVGQQEEAPASPASPGRVVAERVAAEKVSDAPEPTVAVPLARPPWPPVASPFDVPSDAPAASPAAPSGCSALLRPSAIGRYLSRDEICATAAPALQQRVSQQLARVSQQPAVVTQAKALLRREAADVHKLPKVSSEELLPQLECMLSLQRGEPCECEEARALGEVGIEPRHTA